MSERRYTEEEIEHLIYFAQPEDGRACWEAMKQLKSERDEARAYVDDLILSLPRGITIPAKPWEKREGVG